jgi:hypothetical protein
VKGDTRVQEMGPQSRGGLKQKGLRESPKNTISVRDRVVACPEGEAMSRIRRPSAPDIYSTQSDFLPTQLFCIVVKLVAIVVQLNEILALCISAMGC